MREQARFSRRDGDEALAELKRIAQAGVEIWFYQDARRFEYGTFGHNVIGFVEAEMNAEYRRQIARWTADAMKRKALAGHVTGGKTFGYDNLDVIGPGGKRSHVEQRINPDQASVIRRIFELRAEGHGYTAIARRLNDERAPAPGAQRGRPAGWASSSVREALYRTKYRGLVTYGATKKRTPDGRVKSQARPSEEHSLIDASALRIVSDELWDAAHARLAADRTRYTGRPKGRPPAVRGRYLLTGMARCGVCNGGIEAQTRNHGPAHRATFYVCATAQRKGAAVCENRLAVQAESVDAAVLELMEAAVLEDGTREAAIAQATARLSRRDDEIEDVDRELSGLRRKAERLTDVIENGEGDSLTLVTRLRTLEAEIGRRNARLKALAASAAADPQQIRAALTATFSDWRGLLRSEPAAGRRVLQTLIEGRLTFTPGRDDEGEFYEITGHAAVPEMIGEKTLVNVASPTGFEPVFWP